ncbi:non-homologous end-joining DNA ligase [Actinomadura sp. HBU206391]|uniref:non-homologous end-joining DNA ligase n=1 Tax=Actinomadura sp. HBU206391 TaxID=2731692 RepID=UPI001650AB93|nr:non-homologous end-joining DNA ligase [Actinomadura sp. HBU206391]MBC6459768.1 ATP-dependent DNA ligase [Actinomadura sp. HBU206391]
MSPDQPQKIRVRIEGRELTLSNLDKVLYPEHGFTKGEVIDYYTRVAPVLLPHLADRPATRIRYPDGTGDGAFYEKNAPSHTPEWVRTVRLPTPRSTRGASETDFIVIDDLPTLGWCANLAALELHVPQWRVGPRGGVREPDLMVFDLDPGEPATIVDACEVGLMLRDLLDADGLASYPKTSGKKGLHLYVPVEETGRTSDYARKAAERLEREHPDQVLSQMAKRLRKGKVFVDWSQNNPAKTTVAPYSLRAGAIPTVSAPVTWAEVETCREPGDLRFDADEMLTRVDEHGDLLAPLLTERQKLP